MTYGITRRIAAATAVIATLALGAVAAGTANAEDTFTDADRTITLTAAVDNAFDGKDLKAYQLASYSSYTLEGDNVSKITATQTADQKALLKDAINNAGIDGVTVGDNDDPFAVFSAIKGDKDLTATDPKWSSALRKVADRLAKETIPASITGTAGQAVAGNARQWRFTVPAAGYYLILDKTGAGKTGSIPMLVGTTAGGKSLKNDTLGVVEYKSIDDNNTDDKNVPKPGKTADKNDALVGEDITYTLTQKVPNTTGYTGYLLRFSDQPGAGLTFKAITSVTVGGNKLDPKFYELAPAQPAAGQAFTITFGLEDASVDPAVRSILKGDAAAQFPIGAEIKVTYTATVNTDINKDAAAGTNKLTVDYSNNPNAWSTQLGHKVPTDDKGNETHPNNNLAAPIVKSVQADRTTAAPNSKIKIHDGATDALLKFTQVDGKYVLDPNGKIDEITSNGNGEFPLAGLKPGTDYRIEQSGLADGFNAGDTLADFHVTFTPDANGGRTTATLDPDASKNKSGLAFTDGLGSSSVAFVNAHALAGLPLTGGTGVKAAVALALVIALGAAVLARRGAGMKSAALHAA
ncbi:isopeptide-forming domain-containing fimbrial protein [Bifidobacterium myosotis]|nr:isopeptide-forming domain-containing fimbrial protein [Bifidobacterium myosotis]